MMTNTGRTAKLVISALLCAIGIIIPLVSPFKLIIEPASFTLGSHVAIMIAMFLSPPVAVTVRLGTTLGFFFGGFPLVVVLRALTHVVFALTGALILKKHPDILSSVQKTIVFSLGIGLLHALCEVLVSSYFYFGNVLPAANYNKGFFTAIFLLVGVGTIIHSLVDFFISLAIWKALSRQKELKI